MSLDALRRLALGLAGVDTARLAFDAEAAALARAVERYSQDRPKTHAAALQLGGGGADLPAEFVAGFSKVTAVEHPTGCRPPCLLPGDGYYVDATADPPRLEVPAAAANAPVKCLFTAKHRADAAAFTIPDHHAEAVAAWAAAVLCEMEASRLANQSTPTIQADSADQSAPARNFAARAKTLRQRYFDELGLDPKKCAAAGADVAFARRDSAGRPTLTHPLLGGEPWH